MLCYCSKPQKELVPSNQVSFLTLNALGFVFSSPHKPWILNIDVAAHSSASVHYKWQVFGTEKMENDNVGY